MKKLPLALLGMVLTASFWNAEAQNADHGAKAYQLCAGCHGFKGEGNESVGAPRLAGLEEWYVVRQLANFREGRRGYATGDQNGHTMAQMTLGLTESKIADIMAHINTLPIPDAASSISGDAANGKAQYGPCATCHGQSGEGNLALNSPALTNMDDWYILSQLQKFKSGQRGTQPGDTYGQQMAPMASVLANDQAMADVVAYINSLR